MANVNSVLNVARGEIGYREGKNNDNKYGREYGLNNQPWCVIFAWFCFKHANASELFYDGGKVARCSTLYNFHKGKGQQVSVSALKPGDIVFFDFSGRKSATDHVGIVESVYSSYVNTIEGNTGGGSEANGDGVYRKSRNLKYITCAYRPKYEGSVDPTPTEYDSAVCKELQKSFKSRGARISDDGILGPETEGAMSSYICRKGQRNSTVKWIQNRLVAKGYSVGKSGVDGDFGKDTLAAVKSFQTKERIDVDGEVGHDTYMRLLQK